MHFSERKGCFAVTSKESFQDTGGANHIPEGHALGLVRAGRLASALRLELLKARASLLLAAGCRGGRLCCRGRLWLLVCNTRTPFFQPSLPSAECFVGCLHAFRA